MKYLLAFLFFIPFHSIALFRDCFKSQEEKNREEVEERAYYERINMTQDLTIELSKVNPKRFNYRHHDSGGCPEIRKTVPAHETKKMVWQLTIDSNPENCVEIVDPLITSITVQPADRDYHWTIKPLAKGTALLKARYATRDGCKVEEEQTITVTVTE